jgi:hypothetical protein
MAASEYNETKKKDPLSGGLAGAAFFNLILQKKKKHM